jgi:hypothetical protein
VDDGETWMELALCQHHRRLGWVKDRDRTGIGETSTMAVICARCPVYFECAEFAGRAEITSGFWAGEHREPPAESFGGAA